MRQAVYNTKEKGEIGFILFKEDQDYVAVCLNFNLVEYGKNPKELEKSIEEAALSYLEAVNKKGLPDDYLNVGTEQKYLDIFKNIELSKELYGRKIQSSQRQLETPPKKDLISFRKQPYSNNKFITA